MRTSSPSVAPESGSTETAHPSGNAETVVESERRRSRRYPANGVAEFAAYGSYTRGFMRDFSAAGCLVLTRSRAILPLKSTVQLRFTLFGIHFSTDAEVVRIARGEYVAFRFVSSDPTFAEKLAILCEERTYD